MLRAFPTILIAVLAYNAVAFASGAAGQHDINLQVTQEDNSAAAGTILTQSPGAQSLVTPGQTTVTVTVSNGPPESPIPDTSNMSCQQAQQTLQQNGFTNVSVQYGWFNKDQSWGTNPSAGQSAPADSSITLQCGWGGV